MAEAPVAPAAPAATPATPVAPAVVVAATPDPVPPTIVGSAAADPVAPVTPSTPATWPDDWRQQVAGADAKKLQRLERYASPKDVADALIAAQNKISSGELKPSLSANATPEELKQWRSDRGIPETHDKYDTNLGNGVVIGEADKPFVDSYLKKAHEANLTPDQVKASLGWYFEETQQRTAARATADREAQSKGETTLRAEWGAEYQRDLTLITSYLDTAPPGFKERFIGGRLADGTPIGSDPDALRWLLGKAMELNPMGTVVPGAGSNQLQGVNEEIAAIEKLMRTNRSEYNRDNAKQARYRDLLEYRENMNAKAGGTKAA